MIPVSPRHRVVLSYGRFDQFNQFHVSLLRQLCALGDELIIGCATDDFALFEGRPCAQNYDQRRATLERCRFVSRVIPEDTWEQKHTDIVNYNVSVFAMGAQWSGQFDNLRDITKVCYLNIDETAPENTGKRQRTFA
ncbi:MAG: adenylyltransferase/cytidyltransferase family protein [Sulfitobacter sp.]